MEELFQPHPLVFPLSFLRRGGGEKRGLAAPLGHPTINRESGTFSLAPLSFTVFILVLYGLWPV
jgi:hypothetical protein